MSYYGFYPYELLVKFYGLLRSCAVVLFYTEWAASWFNWLLNWIVRDRRIKSTVNYEQIATWEADYQGNMDMQQCFTCQRELVLRR